MAITISVVVISIGAPYIVCVLGGDLGREIRYAWTEPSL